MWHKKYIEGLEMDWKWKKQVPLCVADQEPSEQHAQSILAVDAKSVDAITQSGMGWDSSTVSFE